MSSAVAQLGALLESLQSRVAELEKRAGAPVGAAPVASATAAAASAKPAAVSATDDEPSSQTREFDALVAKFGDELAKVSGEIGGDVATLGNAILALWKENRKMVHLATKCKKPAAEELAKLRAAVTDAAKPIFALKASRECKVPNHAAGAADAAPAFAWVNLEGGPLETITAAREGCDFFLNKVRKQSKDESDPRHMAFANLIRDGLIAMHDFAKEHFKMGLAWNGKGADVGAFLGGAAAASSPAAGGAGAAPKPATPAAAAPAAAAAVAKPAAAATPAGGAGGDPAALQSQLFAQLSSIDQSSGRTAGLRHVTKDMKSKPGEAPAVVPAAGAGAAAKPAAAAVSKGRDDGIPSGTARLELVDKRYYVEFQQTKGAQIHVPAEGGKPLTIAHEVYIYACKDVAVFLDAKCKGVRMDKCSNVTVIIESVLSGVEVVNSKRIKMQVKQSMPSVAIDKTDGIVVGLSWPARDAQIVTSKSSEMNVTFPVSEDPDAEWVEMPIPEQFVTKVTKENKLLSSVSELYTH